MEAQRLADLRLRLALVGLRRAVSILLLVDQPPLDGAPGGQQFDPLELLLAVLAVGRGAGRLGLGVLDPMPGVGLLGAGIFQLVLGLDRGRRSRPDSRDVADGLGLADRGVGAIEPGPGDVDTQPGRVLAGSCAAESFLLLIDQETVHRPLFLQLGDATVLLRPVLPLRGGRGGVGLGDLDAERSGFPPGSLERSSASATARRIPRAADASSRRPARAIASLGATRDRLIPAATASRANAEDQGRRRVGRRCVCIALELRIG